jgi:hypothetical protein
MAKAYLGKISAIVTANTSDFNSKLNASAKEVRTFASSMQSTLSRAESGAAASLRGIYTEAQKTERALKAAAGLRLSFKGIDTSKFKDIGEAADQFRRVASAAEQINKPLAAAAKATPSSVVSANQRVASHARSAQAGKHTTLAEHMPASHRAHLEWTPAKLIAWGRRIGVSTAAVVTWQLERRPHPEQGYRACLGLQRLAREYTPLRLEAACTRALAIRSPTYRSVASILKTGLDRQPSLFPTAAPALRKAASMLPCDMMVSASKATRSPVAGADSNMAFR